MKANILIIDDEPKWISFAKDDLGAFFEVDVAANRGLALEMLRAKDYDLIIASSRRLDALEAIHREYPRERLIVATGQPTTREAIKMYRLGASDYIAKELRHGSVSQKIKAVIQKPANVSVQ